MTELVKETAACPSCGERDMDKLVWDETIHFVVCDSCGCCYDPPSPECESGEKLAETGYIGLEGDEEDYGPAAPLG